MFYLNVKTTRFSGSDFKYRPLYWAYNSWAFASELELENWAKEIGLFRYTVTDKPLGKILGMTGFDRPRGVL